MGFEVEEQAEVDDCPGEAAPPINQRFTRTPLTATGMILFISCCRAWPRASFC